MDQQTIQELSSTGRHQECLQACQQLLQNEPENPLPWKFAGKSLLALGKFEKAQQCLNKAHQLDTNDPEIAKDIGNSYLNLGDKDTAAQWYEKSLSINNNYAPAITNLANTKKQGGNNQEAVVLFKRAIQADPQLIQAYAGAAASSLALGDLDQAELFATQAIEINAHAPSINEILGIIFQNKKKFRQAIESYQKELGINPQSNTSLLNLGYLFLKQGKAASAIEPLATAAAINSSEQCSLLLAQAYQNLGQFTEAIAEYKKLNINQSKDKLIPFNLGLCLLNKGENIDAIEAFKIAVQLDNSLMAAWGNMGNCLKNIGQLEKACEAYERVLAASPDNVIALEAMADILQQSGNFSRSIRLLRRALEISPDECRMLSNLGFLLCEIEEYEQAIEICHKSIAINPKYPDAYNNIAPALKAQGQLNEALSSTLKSLELKPDNPDALMNLGGIYKDLGKLDQALASTLKSLDLKPDNPDALINLGGIYKDLGNLDQALASTLKSLELKPDNPDALINLGGIYKDLGNLDQALASTLKSLELKPDNPTAHINLGGIYKDLGNLDQALASTLKSLELKPDNPTAHINLGGIYKDLERIEDAKTATNHALRATRKDTNTVTMILEFYDSINEEELLEEAIIYLKSALPNKSKRITMYEARVLFRQRKYEESWAKLPTLDSASKDLNDWFSILKYHAFRAQIAEKHNQYDNAYYSFEASQADPLYKSIDHKKEHYRVHEYITLSENMSKDRASIDFINQTQSDSQPVFLIGFPRSGTTLLDTVLRSHPEVEVIEEKDPLGLAESLVINNLQRQISNFNSLKEDDLNIMRETYNTRLKFHSKDADKLIIDKLPLHTVAIPLINLLFPNAKVIFALRHPCDSILSCFQQTFKPNTAMANFTTLDRSVDYYDKVMNGWTTYNENLNLDYTISKYEDLLDNFDESVLKVLKHLNLPWDDGVRDYRSTAKNRISINTPSSSQVVQPLYKSSVGRWKNYQKHFAKHMDKLNPWIDYFGYER